MGLLGKLSGIRHPQIGYPLLIFSWAALAYGVAPLLEVGTTLAQLFSGIAIFLGGVTTIVGIVEIWRHG